jgi:transcriptional regulator with XRE-family HTH domain
VSTGDVDVNVREQLRQRRIELGLSQYELAERLEIRDATLSRWESGIVNPPLNKVEHWADRLGVKLGLFQMQLTLLPSPGQQELLAAEPVPMWKPEPEPRKR